MREELTDQSRELLGQVLAVGVEDAEQPEVVPDAVVEDDLVAAAVAEVPRVAYRVDVPALRSELLADALDGLPRVVGALLVQDHDPVGELAGRLLPRHRGDRPGQMLRGVIGGDEDANPAFVQRREGPWRLTTRRVNGGAHTRDRV